MQYSSPRRNIRTVRSARPTELTDRVRKNTLHAKSINSIVKFYEKESKSTYCIKKIILQVVHGITAKIKNYVQK